MNPLPASKVKLRLGLQVLWSLLLWASFISFPHGPQIGLDASWQQTLVYAHTQGWQFGRELIFTWGPWGFLNSAFHIGEPAAGVRILWECAGKLALAAGLVAMTRHLSAWRQAAFVLLSVIYAPVFLDTPYVLFIALAVLTLLLRPKVARTELFLLLGFLTFLAQIKFTYALLAAIGIGLAVLQQAWGRRWLDASLTGVGFLAGFVAWWIAAGQHPDHIFPYLLRSWELSAGYNQAMGMEAATPVLLVGCALLIAGGTLVWRLWHSTLPAPTRPAVALFVSLCFFLVWKHGFTRADGHVVGFFLFCLPFFVAVPTLCAPGTRPLAFDLAGAGCLVGLWLFSPELFRHVPSETPTRLQTNLRNVAYSLQLPAKWAEEWRHGRDRHALPAIARTIGEAPVDFYNYEQAVVLLNGLRLSPRPVFQSYSAYTGRLAWRNLRHMLTTPPAYLLWHHVSIDGRFPAQDDAWLVAEAPRLFEPVTKDGAFLLLKSRANRPAQPQRREPLAQLTVGLDEVFPVPSHANYAVWMRISMQPTFLGKLRTALYRPAVLTLHVEEVTGRQTEWRLIPPMVGDGVLVQPFLETTDDFAAYLQGRGRKRIKSLRITSADGSRDFWKGAKVDFHALPETPVVNEAHHLGTAADGITNLQSVTLTTSSPMEIASVDAGPAALMHAPSEATFPVPRGVRCVTAGFGLLPGAYTNGAETDGVKFSIVATWPDGWSRVLWSRHLDPRHHAADRGTQFVDVELPADQLSRVTLRTAEGPAGDGRWD